MIVVLGATGHVGSAVADTLLKQGEAVCVVTRSDAKAAGWREKGAEVAVVDVGDAAALAAVFRDGRRAFLLNPPAAPATDTDAEERRTLGSIAAALQSAKLEKVVLQSTYGARPGTAIGDLGTLHDFETAAARQPIPVTVLRGAYYMSNWDALLDAARAGRLPTMLPPDLKLPMVAPADLGRAAARLLLEPAERTGLVHVEGPKRYSANDVAESFAAALGRPVRVEPIPREAWEDAFRKLGFSDAAARSYAGMNALVVDGGVEPPERPERGQVTLDAYIADLVRAAPPA